ncbi:hypothetical protein [Actinomadura oligospora]|nr:hypothetical protein [Actinomadura oligospora]
MPATTATADEVHAVTTLPSVDRASAGFHAARTASRTVMSVGTPSWSVTR